MSTPRKLIVGLGNPGSTYAQNRHNAGFLCIDAFASKHGLSFNKMMFRGLTAHGTIEGQSLALVKPMTFMNLSGECVGSLARFYKVPPEAVLVIYDDLDLPPGQLRLRAQGGAGGHNGMKSIIAHLGTEAFPRLRIGIGRPPDRMAPRDYVLQDLTQVELDQLRATFDRAAEGIRLWLTEGIERAMNWVNAAPAKPKSQQASSDAIARDG
ncbi:MAG: aminoacyl-tRNA hydrolase [Anaerolineae bacterium]|nr:aminoacyl-tRNA hydrolase [Thermoflexales bacterium]MDW8396226.1 aminoacyl-tRNA hydrolase [Anaerolineae bacterium]